MNLNERLHERICQVINDPLFEEVLVSRGISLGAFKMDMEFWFHDCEFDRLPEAYRAAIATVEQASGPGCLGDYVRAAILADGIPEPIPANPSHSEGLGGSSVTVPLENPLKRKESQFSPEWDPTTVCSVEEVAALMDELSHWKELVEFWRGRAVLAENKLKELEEDELIDKPGN